MIEFHRELETDTVINPMIISCMHTIPLSNIKDINNLLLSYLFKHLIYISCIYVSFHRLVWKKNITKRTFIFTVLQFSLNMFKNMF